MKTILIFFLFVFSSGNLFSQEVWDNWKPYSSESFYEVNQNSQDHSLKKKYDIFNPRFYVSKMQNRFLSVDGFADKYPSLTPYQYAANNPILFIDVNGDSIWVNYYDDHRQRHAVYYNDGKFYNRDGSVYSGSNSFVSAVGDALHSLEQGTRGSALVNFLVRNSANVNIFSAGRNAANETIVYFNSNSTIGGLNVDGTTASKSFIGLGHELAHVEGFLTGRSESGIWYNAIDGTPVANSEKYATHVENQIRSEHSMALREFYSYTVTPPSSSWPIPRYTGNPRGRLLLPGTSYSRFYTQTINMGGNPNYPVLFPFKY